MYEACETLHWVSFQTKGIIMVTRYFMNRKGSALAVLGLVMALLLAACGGGTTGSGSTATPSGGTSTTTTTMTAAAMLKHVPNGTAALSWDPTSQMLTVQLTLVGLAPGSMHPAHIHTGSCANQGNVVHPLTTVVADSHGDATASTMVKVAGGIPASGWYVNVHNGPGLAPADTQFLPIVCGDVANSNTSTSAAQSVMVTMNAAPPASAGQAATGMAKLTLSGTQLTIVVTISGLAPNSMHPAHIHAGTCESQGAVLYPLTTIAADASGNATVTTTVTIKESAIPSTGWYVNVHRDPDLTTSTGFDPIACGNVTVTAG